MTTLVNSVFVSDGGGGLHVYDINNGSTLMYYKCGVINPHCLSILRNDYIFTAENSPIIQVWQINSQEKLNSVRMACPGTIGTLNISPDYCYIAVTSEEKLLMWQICSGKLLCTTRRHYQSISVLRWSKDAAYIITGGNDGLVCVWKLSDLVTGRYSSNNNTQSDGDVQPKHIFSDHCVKISDLHVGNGGSRARIFTASLDKTCRVYDLLSGCQLLCVTFDDQLTAITTDPLETKVFVGAFNGSIRIFSLLHPPRSLDTHFQIDPNHMTCMIDGGHTDRVGSLECTIDGCSLISSSADKTIKIWHINSRQCIRTITMKAAVTNVALKLLPRSFTSKKFQSEIALKSFQKTYDPEYNPDILQLMITRDLSSSSDDDDRNDVGSSTAAMYDDREMMALNEESNTLKTINKQLYDYAVENVLQSAAIPTNRESVIKPVPSTSERNISEGTLEVLMEIRNRDNNEKAKSRKRKRVRKKSRNGVNFAEEPFNDDADS